MESLGGDQMWWDRFLAQHSAIFYFWVLILFYTFAPRMAYVFSELVEVSPQYIITNTKSFTKNPIVAFFLYLPKSF